MRAFRSILGALLATLYGLAFLWAYYDYQQRAGQWLADIGLAVLALPFTLTGRFLAAGAFDFAGDETFKVIGAAVFCCALAYIAGALVEGVLRALYGLLRRGPAA